MYLQVVGSQQLLPAQPSTPPQSQSSPGSTIPFPHSDLVKTLTFLLVVKQEVSICLFFMAEHIAPIVQLGIVR